MNWVILGMAIFLNSTANILIKVGVMDRPLKPGLTTIVRIVLAPAVIGGIICFALALVAYGYVLSKVNLSIAYPLMTSIGFVIVIVASSLFLKESISSIQIFGFFLILSGVWVVAK
jgi:multidrug transporter EmrE-like cation transporter